MGSRGSLWIFLAALYWAPAAPAAQSPVRPVTVCEVLTDIGRYDGKVVAVVGRFSLRESGRWMSEERCGDKPADGAAQKKEHLLWMIEDSKTGPKRPEILEIDGDAVFGKLKTIREHTSLHKFGFGSPDYDRWAIVYGRVEKQKPADKPAAPDRPEAAPALLIFRGDGAVTFVADSN